LKEALQSVRLAQEAAGSSKELAETIAWITGVEAYIHSLLGDHESALDAQERHMNLTKKADPEKAASDWKLPYNLACYYTLVGKLDEAVQPLMAALLLSASARDQAWADDDLRKFRESPAHMEKVSHLMGKAPTAPPEDKPAEG
jgi:hypothetical protein